MRTCVFCGSKAGNDPAFVEAARATGRTLAERNVGLVYGGGHVGLMGVLADAAMAAGGEVIGVIPRDMVESEWAHAGITQLHVVATMHERKALMASKAHAFLALPGGYGTLEEFFEVVTWRQLGYHNKPIGLLNVRGYFDPLLQWQNHGLTAGFIREKHQGLFHVSSDVATLLDLLMAASPS